MKIFSPILKGTTTVSQGTTNLSGSFTGSLLGTAATASYADNFTVGGTLTAQTINVQIITSSIEFNTGSTRNGSSTANTHQFTGSVLMSGSLGIGTSSPLAPLYILAPTTIVDSNGQLFVGASDALGTDKGGQIMLGGKYTSTVNTAFGGIAAKKDNATDGNFGGYFQFFSSTHGVGNTEKMRITSAGNVGIGTSSPSSAGGAFTGLDIRGSSGGSLIMGTASTAYGIMYGESSGFYMQTSTATPLNFLTNATERMRITSAGNVGINTSSPNTSYGATISNPTLNSSNALRLERNNIPTQGLNIIAGGEIVTFNGFNTASDGLNSSFVWTSTAFNTTSERMRITNNGYLLLGQTADNPVVSHTAGVRIGAESIFSQAAGEAMSIQRMNSTGTMVVFYYWSGVGSYVNLGNISTNGSTITFSGTALSDARYKENIVPITNALESINQVDWVEFKFKENQKNSAGITAQQLQTVDALSKFVIDGSDEESYKAVDYNAIIGYLGKAIQELSAKNTLLEERLTALENN